MAVSVQAWVLPELELVWARAGGALPVVWCAECRSSEGLLGV